MQESSKLSFIVQVYAREVRNFTNKWLHEKELEVSFPKRQQDKSKQNSPFLDKTKIKTLFTGDHTTARLESQVYHMLCLR